MDAEVKFRGSGDEIAYPGQMAVPCLFMRGGSSRGGYFLADDLPQDEKRRAAFLLAAYGSPDLRQIDGIGGSDPLTSKAAAVARSERPDADLEYTFFQVGIDQAKVSTGGNCGNMLAGVGLFGILRGLVTPVEPVTEVRIYTTNIGQVITARITVENGVPAVDGDCVIAGVPEPGARIELDFGDCSGAVSGKLLPTGNACDTLDLDGRQVRVSLIDAATPFVFVAAEDVGAEGTEGPEAILADGALLDRLEKVRGWAAVQIGLVDDPANAKPVTPNIPRVMMVTRPKPYLSSAGAEIDPADCDLVVRQLAMQHPHRALAVTGSVCAAVAASVPGSVPAELRTGGGEETRLGHPSGVIRVAGDVSVGPDGKVTIKSARIERSARLIMAGTVYARLSDVDRLTGDLSA